jgi:hypothetical protein
MFLKKASGKTARGHLLPSWYELLDYTAEDEQSITYIYKKEGVLRLDENPDHEINYRDHCSFKIF